MPPKKSKAAAKKPPAKKKVAVPNPRTGECHICFENLDNDYAELKCNHFYCYNCINTWSQKETTCPVCKGRFSYMYRIQKNPETNEYSKTRLTVKKASQAETIRRDNQRHYASMAGLASSISPYQLFSILSYSTLNMLHSGHHDHYDEDEDDDYDPEHDHDHFFDDDDDDDDEEDISDMLRAMRNNRSDEDEEEGNIYRHMHRLFEDIMPERRGTSQNPISLLDEDDAQRGVSSGYRSTNSSSSSQPIVIDLTDDQVQSDIRDIAEPSNPTNTTNTNPSSSSSSSSAAANRANDKPSVRFATIGSRRRRFVPEDEVELDERESGYTARRVRTNSTAPPPSSQGSVIEEIEL